MKKVTKFGLEVLTGRALSFLLKFIDETGENVFSLQMQIKLKGLFTRREGYLCARVTLVRVLKLALVYKQISQVGLPYHPGQLYQLYCGVLLFVTFSVTVQNLK